MKPITVLVCLGLFSVVLVATAAYLSLYVQHRWRVSLPLGGRAVSVPAVPLIRAATTPLGGRLLDGRTVRTQVGDVRLAWDASSRRLRASCAPCSLNVPALGAQPILLTSATATIQRSGDALSGDVRSGTVVTAWDATLLHDGVRVRMRLRETPAADVLALFARQVPEVKRARIVGTVAFDATMDLPAGVFEVRPKVALDYVDGLGTQRLRGLRARPRCNRPANKYGLVAAAVIAAEDQRFYEHHGFDARELNAAFRLNGSHGQARRGASTITQQVARMMFVGGERDLPRKLRELLYAVEMERTLGKAQILTLYLDAAPWGDGVCGAEAAAKRYFAKRASQLRPDEAARLAAMLRHGGPTVVEDARETAHVLQIARDMRVADRAAKRAAIKRLTAQLRRAEQSELAAGTRRESTLAAGTPRRSTPRSLTEPAQTGRPPASPPRQGEPRLQSPTLAIAQH